jgi:hypothetical protein
VQADGKDRARGDRAAQADLRTAGDGRAVDKQIIDQCRQVADVYSRDAITIGL